MGTIPESMRERVEETRRIVSDLHAELPRWGLVVWTAGNVSQRVRGEAASEEHRRHDTPHRVHELHPIRSHGSDLLRCVAETITAGPG